MKITLDFLESYHACKEGINWFTSQQDDDLMVIIRKLMEEERFQWANWLISNILDRQNVVRYAIFSAESVLDLFEKKYPDIKKPRLAIEAAKRCLDDTNHSDVYACAAHNAIYAASEDAYSCAADYAADAAAAAAHAAYIYAHDAACAAADADIAASDAAWAAYQTAYNAAGDTAYTYAVDAANAARKEMYKKVLNYGITLFTSQEQLKGEKL